MHLRRRKNRGLVACMSSVEYVENIFLYITWNSMMFDKWMQECCLFMGKFSFVAVCLSLPMPDFLQAWNDGTKKLWARPSCSTHLQGGLMLGRQIRYQRHHKNFIFELQRFFTQKKILPSKHCAATSAFFFSSTVRGGCVNVCISI